MRAFIDTSSLIKRYYSEKGAEQLQDLLGEISCLTVAPTAFLEMSTTLSRFRREKVITQGDSDVMRSILRNDFNFFEKVSWNEELELLGVVLSKKYPLKSLDCIQLASASLAQTELFITSDKSLFNAAKKELEVVQYI